MVEQEAKINKRDKKSEQGSYQPYSNYQDTEDILLNRAPSHWEESKIKHMFERIESGTTPSRSEEEYYDGDIGWVNIEDLNDGCVSDTGQKVTEYALENNTGLEIYPKGTLLMAMYGASIGKLGILNFPSTTNQACCALVNSKNDVLNKYVFYLLFALRNDLIKVSYGGAQDNISQGTVKNFRLYRPPMEEQKAIVEFLDKETGDIDQLVEKKRQLINLLEEKRTALIKSAVGNGIETEVGRRENGVEWLGKIPKHWEVRKLRYLADIDTGGKDTKDAVDDGEYPFFVRSPTKERIDTYSFDGEAVLTAGDGVGVGEVFHYIDGKFDYHQRVYKISGFSEELDGKYLYYYIKANLKMEIFKNNAKSTVDSLRMPMFKSFPVAFGDIEEQRDIVKYLDNQNKHIDNLIKKVEEGIKRLKEYRTALITEAVTGQIDVRGEV